ncbi:uncharacterized protein LOC115739213 [Rhodamnia argentea]|uniref:Uncharacterized protein LOC115739213 n=1 Tax=Rhodamnia argentea TaxID=178133 RepID=A0A8B8NZY3_9MYRT|nr:uncharacterized protein LOC115739213 [Rhodamnia argentea]
MFFFFVGGLEQQVRLVQKSGAGRCIACGSRADLVDYDKVLKVFFVPVWRWPGKAPLMHCSSCHLFFPPSASLPPPPPRMKAEPHGMRCGSCGRPVEPEFSFCPFCGAAL